MPSTMVPVQRPYSYPICFCGIIRYLDVQDELGAASIRHTKIRVRGPQDAKRCDPVAIEEQTCSQKYWRFTAKILSFR